MYVDYCKGKVNNIKPINIFSDEFLNLFVFQKKRFFHLFFNQDDICFALNLNKKN